jgi:hypothetical protein
MWKKHVREILLLTVFLIIAFTIGISSNFLNKSQTRTTSAFAAEADNYCRNGVYYVKNPDNPNGELSCGRGVCDGVSYEGTASIDAKGNGKCWWGDSDCGPACKGYVPLCCYKMAETGDAKDCPFPERKYCRHDQCNRQTKNEDANCGSGISTYCADIPNCLEDRDDVPVLSLEDRLAGRKTPSNVGTSPTDIPQNTATPKPANATATPVPNQQATATPRVNPTQGGSNNSQSGITIFPINSPIPTPTHKQLTSDNSLSQPTGSQTTDNDSPAGTNDDNPDSVALPGLNTPELNFELPQLTFKAPNQILKESVTGESIENLNRATEPPLMAAENTLVTIKSYDQQLENTVEGWIDYIRIRITKLFQ